MLFVSHSLAITGVVLVLIGRGLKHSKSEKWIW
jgi:hypothetical protein